MNRFDPHPIVIDFARVIDRRFAWLIDRVRSGALLLLAGLAALALPTASPASPQAVDAVERGREIAIEADRRDSGWGDSTAMLRMTLRNPHGEDSTLELRARELEVDGDGDKLLVIFDRPDEVQNIAFLSSTHRHGADDQWLYLPGPERVERIASRDRSAPFMGSEFAYEDFTSHEVDKYSHTWLRDEIIDGLPVFVIERLPLDESSGYTRQVVWMDQEEYRVWKVDFYDLEGELLKTLRYLRYREYPGGHWRPHVMHMVNHQTGRSTTLEWRQYEFGTGLHERDFRHDTLARLR